MVLTPVENRALGRLAEIEGGLSKAATVRRWIHQEAHRRGLLPIPADEIQLQAEEAQADG
jgi:hypothetical protein